MPLFVLAGVCEVGLVAVCFFFLSTAARVNQPPVAVVSPRIQELTVPLTSALIDGSRVYPPCLGGFCHSVLPD